MPQNNETKYYGLRTSVDVVCNKYRFNVAFVIRKQIHKKNRRTYTSVLKACYNMCTPTCVRVVQTKTTASCLHAQGILELPIRACVLSSSD